MFVMIQVNVVGISLFFSYAHKSYVRKYSNVLAYAKQDTCTYKASMHIITRHNICYNASTQTKGRKDVYTLFETQLVTFSSPFSIGTVSVIILRDKNKQRKNKQRG